MKTDTPETVRFYESFFDGLGEWIALCERLERERDEAGRIAEHWLRVACSPFNPAGALPWCVPQADSWANSPIHKQIAEAGLDPLAEGITRVSTTQPIENQSRYTGIEPVFCDSEPT